MASGNEYLEQSLETDNASLLYQCEEETGHPEKFIACSEREYRILFPPQIPDIRPEINSGARNQGIEYYQCSQNKDEMGSASDSAEEENSPYGSPEKQKYEMMVVSGKSSSDASRKQRLPNAITTYEEPREQSTLALGRSEALALSGSRKENPSPTKTSNTVMPRGEMDSPVVVNNSKRDGLSNLTKKENINEDVNVRLMTFLSKGWPHATPSAEAMAKAGLGFKGKRLYILDAKIFLNFIK